MTALRFEFEWVDSGPSTDRLSQATMADVGIKLGDVAITSHIDEKTQAYKERITAPLFPIAEWVVANWWTLWFEQELVGPGSPRPGFAERHNLSFAGRGFLYPKLLVSPLNDFVNLRAEKWRPKYSSVEFVRDQTEVLSRDHVVREFSRIVEIVIDRLRQFGLSGQPIEEDWNAIQDSDCEILEFCQAAATMGLDPFDLDDPTSEAIIDLWNSTPASLRNDLFSCTDVDSGRMVLAWVKGQLAQVDITPSGVGWDKLRGSIQPLKGALPWDRGYELAQQARGLMGVEDGAFDFTGEWSVGFATASSPADHLEAVVSGTSPSCVIRPRTKPAQRFLFARALGDFLVRHQDEPSLLTAFSSDRQAQTRSFAAEFLAPSNVLRKELGALLGRRISSEQVEELSEKFRVSSFVIRHQIDNHKLGFISEVA